MGLNKTIKSSATLMLVAFIWGLAFVGQRTGTEYLGPFFFIGSRMFLGVLTLAIPMYIKYVIDRRSQLNPTPRLTIKEYFKQNKLLIQAGCSCGAVLFFAMLTQQIALIYTSASKAGFLTTLYIVIVPIVGIFMHKSTHWNTWISVLIAVIGLYLLTVTDGFSMGLGDTILIGGAFFWAFHIIVIDHFAPKVDVVKMSLIQFIFNCVAGFALSPIFDHLFMPNMSIQNVIDAVPALLWVGVLSSGIAFTLQSIGQKGANPTAAAVILSLEAVFSLIGGFLILGETLTPKESLGCVLMFVAVVLAQIPIKSKSKNKRKIL
jgi:drug/metabolite transporter (DMT)-like permease